MYQNPYMNTNYNPYQTQYQQYAPQYQAQNGLSGRYVDSFDSITANEVSMDGKPSFFIKNDMSEIQARVWNANGTISNFVFKPLFDEKGINSQETNKNSFSNELGAFKTEIFNRLDAIENRLPKPRAKKEVVVDE